MLRCLIIINLFTEHYWGTHFPTRHHISNIITPSWVLGLHLESAVKIWVSFDKMAQLPDSALQKSKFATLPSQMQLQHEPFTERCAFPHVPFFSCLRQIHGSPKYHTCTCLSYATCLVGPQGQPITRHFSGRQPVVLPCHLPSVTSIHVCPKRLTSTKPLLCLGPQPIIRQCNGSHPAAALKGHSCTIAFACLSVSCLLTSPRENAHLCATMQQTSNSHRRRRNPPAHTHIKA